MWEHDLMVPLQRLTESQKWKGFFHLGVWTCSANFMPIWPSAFDTSGSQTNKEETWNSWTVDSLLWKQQLSKSPLKGPECFERRKPTITPPHGAFGPVWGDEKVGEYNVDISLFSFLTQLLSFFICTKECNTMNAKGRLCRSVHRYLHFNDYCLSPCGCYKHGLYSVENTSEVLRRVESLSIYSSVTIWVNPVMKTVACCQKLWNKPASGDWVEWRFLVSCCFQGPEWKAQNVLSHTF